MVGCFLMITRELWDDLGGFDPVFFMYGEETDLCLRARERGFRPMITPDATIVHHGAASEPSEAHKLVRLLGARALLMRVHWSRPAAFLGIWGSALGCGHRALWGRLLRPFGLPRDPASIEGWSAAWQRRREWMGAP